MDRMVRESCSLFNFQFEAIRSEGIQLIICRWSRCIKIFDWILNSSSIFISIVHSLLQSNKRSGILQRTFLRSRTRSATLFRTFRTKWWSWCLIRWSSSYNFFCTGEIAITFLHLFAIVGTWWTIFH